MHGDPGNGTHYHVCAPICYKWLEPIGYADSVILRSHCGVQTEVSQIVPHMEGGGSTALDGRKISVEVEVKEETCSLHR